MEGDVAKKMRKFKDAFLVSPVSGSVISSGWSLIQPIYSFSLGYTFNRRGEFTVAIMLFYKVIIMLIKLCQLVTVGILLFIFET